MNSKAHRTKTWLEPLIEITGDRRMAAEVLSFIEDQEKKEKEKRRKTQREGMRQAKENGVNFGRPKKVLPENYERICNDFLDKKITAEQAAKYCQVGLSTFYRKVKMYRQKRKTEQSL